jgi:putative Holliday junction resolvase
VGVVTETTGTRALGVDLGERRIGLALSDPSRTVASPHEVLRRSGDPVVDRRAIVDAARDLGADVIVVGLPLSLSGHTGPAAKAALAEVEALRAVAGPIDVVVQDERLTTVTAERALGEARMRRDARRNVVDKVAAAVMLQAWLERPKP